MYIYKEALETFGIEHQVKKTIEEMAELTQALCRYLNGEAHNAEEEIADVKITLAQLEFLFDTIKVKEWEHAKLARLKQYIQQEKSK